MESSRRCTIPWLHSKAQGEGEPAVSSCVGERRGKGADSHPVQSRMKTTGCVEHVAGCSPSGQNQVSRRRGRVERGWRARGRRSVSGHPAIRSTCASETETGRVRTVQLALWRLCHVRRLLSRRERTPSGAKGHRRNPAERVQHVAVHRGTQSFEQSVSSAGEASSSGRERERGHKGSSEPSRRRQARCLRCTARFRSCLGFSSPLEPEQ